MPSPTVDISHRDFSDIAPIQAPPPLANDAPWPPRPISDFDRTLTPCLTSNQRRTRRRLSAEFWPELAPDSVAVLPKVRAAKT